MQAEELLKGGNIAEALKELQGRVRKAPQDAKLRTFLFQLLCVMGDWPRALTQLKLCGELEAQNMVMVRTYREAIGCEMLREKVFAGTASPLVFGEPQEWIALLLEALKPLAAGNVAAAADLRAKAFDAAPASSGSADGTDFAWIADADMRIGPILELIMNGKYYWAPFSSIASITFDPPTDLRDHVWTPVTVRWANGGEVVGLVPTRYPGTAAKGPDAARLSRLTEWEDLGAETFAGIGQRVLATDAADIPLMDARLIGLNNVVAAEEPHE